MTSPGPPGTAAHNRIHDGLRSVAMKSLFQIRKGLVVVASFVVAVALGASGQALAGDHHHHGHSHRGYRSSGPIWHGPSVHYDSYYHHDYSHWTPGRGWHSHGHYHTVPHYTPGHFDYRH